VTTHDFKVGDVVRMNGTQQDAEVIELAEDDFRGELLRVRLLGVPPTTEAVVFFTPQLVELVRAGGAEPHRPGKKILT
jgi:hypothetical protein